MEKTLKLLSYYKEGDLEDFQVGKKGFVKIDKKVIEITILEVVRPEDVDNKLNGSLPKNLNSLILSIRKLIVTEKVWFIKGKTTNGSWVIILFLENFQLYIAEVENSETLYITIKDK